MEAFLFVGVFFLAASTHFKSFVPVLQKTDIGVHASTHSKVAQQWNSILTSTLNSSNCTFKYFPLEAGRRAACGQTCVLVQREHQERQPRTDPFERVATKCVMPYLPGANYSLWDMQHSIFCNFKSRFVPEMLYQSTVISSKMQSTVDHFYKNVHSYTKGVDSSQGDTFPMVLTLLEQAGIQIASSLQAQSLWTASTHSVVMKVIKTNIAILGCFSFAAVLTSDAHTKTTVLLSLRKTESNVDTHSDILRVTFFVVSNSDRLYSKQGTFSLQHAEKKSRGKQRNRIVSDIVGVSVSTSKQALLKTKVVITFTHRMCVDWAMHTPQCMFWDTSAYRWSSSGCWILSFNNTHSHCQCNHLTSFAVLINVKRGEELSSHPVLVQMTLVGNIVSMVCLGITLFTFNHFENLNSRRNRLHKNLSCSLLLGNLMFFIGSFLDGNAKMCLVFTVGAHYFYLSAWSWMFVEGLELFFLFAQPLMAKQVTMSMVGTYGIYGIGYILPLLVVVVTIAVTREQYKAAGYCWLNCTNGSIWGFVGPVIVIVSINTFVLGFSTYVMLNHSYKSKAKKSRPFWTKFAGWVKGIWMLVAVLGIPWIIGIFDVNEKTIVLSYLFVALASTQGMYLFVLHCYFNVKVRVEYQRVFLSISWLPKCLLPDPIKVKGKYKKEINKERRKSVWKNSSTHLDNKCREQSEPSVNKIRADAFDMFLAGWEVETIDIPLAKAQDEDASERDDSDSSDDDFLYVFDEPPLENKSTGMMIASAAKRFLLRSDANAGPSDSSGQDEAGLEGSAGCSDSAGQGVIQYMFSVDESQQAAPTKEQSFISAIFSDIPELKEDESSLTAGMKRAPIREKSRTSKSNLPKKKNMKPDSVSKRKFSTFKRIKSSAIKRIDTLHLATKRSFADIQKQQGSGSNTSVDQSKPATGGLAPTTKGMSDSGPAEETTFTQVTEEDEVQDGTSATSKSLPEPENQKGESRNKLLPFLCVPFWKAKTKIVSKWNEMKKRKKNEGSGESNAPTKSPDAASANLSRVSDSSVKSGIRSSASYVKHHVVKTVDKHRATEAVPKRTSPSKTTDVSYTNLYWLTPRAFFVGEDDNGEQIKPSSSKGRTVMNPIYPGQFYVKESDSLTTGLAEESKASPRRPLVSIPTDVVFEDSPTDASLASSSKSLLFPSTFCVDPDDSFTIATDDGPAKDKKPGEKSTSSSTNTKDLMKELAHVSTENSEYIEFILPSADSVASTSRGVRSKAREGGMIRPAVQESLAEQFARDMREDSIEHQPWEMGLVSGPNNLVRQTASQLSAAVSPVSNTLGAAIQAAEATVYSNVSYRGPKAILKGDMDLFDLLAGNRNPSIRIRPDVSKDFRASREKSKGKKKGKRH
ncbi:uncharacterized protein [Littorina saxatilis]|uniref:uncharacterized protein n=1 Tax=Littorina saxatilis TaxID=31220 RepID=UPI0038B55850